MLIRKTVNKKIDNGQIKPVHVLGRLTVLQEKPRGRVEKKSIVQNRIWMASAEPQRTERLKCTIESFQKLKSFSHKLRRRKLSQTITSKTNQRLPYEPPIVAHELKRSVFHKKQQQQK